MKSKNHSKKRMASKIGIRGKNEKLTALNAKMKNFTLIASEKTLARDWLTEKENKAWYNL